MKPFKTFDLTPEQVAEMPEWGEKGSAFLAQLCYEPFDTIKPGDRPESIQVKGAALDLWESHLLKAVMELLTGKSEEVLLVFPHPITIQPVDEDSIRVQMGHGTNFMEMAETLGEHEAKQAREATP